MPARKLILSFLGVLMIASVAGIVWFDTGEPGSRKSSGAANSPNAPAQRLGSDHPPVQSGRPGARIAIESEPEQTPRASDASVLSAIERDYLKRWNEGGDLKSLADRLLEKAKEGEADAQYYLSRILVECEYFTSAYKDESEFRQRLNKDRMRSKDKFIELMKMEQGACEGFWGVDIADRYGSRFDWFKKAVESGFVLAMAETVVRHSANNSVTEDPEMMGRLRESLKFMHPVALMELKMVMGETVPPSILNRGAATVTIVIAMMKLACDQGYPCSPDSRLVARFCGSRELMCPALESQEDVIRAFAGSGRYQDVVTVSEKIAEAIEEDRLEELFENG